MFQAVYRSNSLRRLTDGTSAVDAAEESRRAATAFVNGTLRGWTQWDLAHWAAGPYRRALDCVDQRIVARMLRRVLRDFGREIDEARRATLKLLDELAGPYHRIAFAEWAQARGFVLPCNANGEGAWIAGCPDDATLAHAVPSLFVADWLLRPKDYSSSMTICARCTAVVFDPGARSRGDCGLHDGERPLRAEIVEPAIAAAPAKTRPFRMGACMGLLLGIGCCSDGRRGGREEAGPRLGIR